MVYLDNIEIGIDDTSIGDPNAFGNQAHVDEVIEPIQDSSIFGGDDSSSSSKGGVNSGVNTGGNTGGNIEKNTKSWIKDPNMGLSDGAYCGMVGVATFGQGLFIGGLFGTVSAYGNLSKAAGGNTYVE